MKPQDRRLIRRMLSFVRPHLKWVFLAVLVLPFIALCRLLGPYFLKLAVDGPIREGDTHGVMYLAGLYLVTVVVLGALNLAQHYVMQMLGQRIVSDLRQTLFGKLTELNMSYLDRTPLGRIVSRLTNDVDAMNEFLSSGLLTLMSDGVMLIGIVIVMFQLNAKLAFLSLVFVLPLIVFVAVIRVVLRRLYRDLSTKNAVATAFASESLAGRNIVQAFRQEPQHKELYREKVHDSLAEDLRAIIWSSELSAVVELASYLSIGLLLFFGTSSQVSLGLLIAFIEYIQLFYRPIEGLSSRFAVLQRALASGEKIFKLFDDAEEHCDAQGQETLNPLTDKIVFDAVNFSYVDGTPVLRDFHLEIPKGQTVALVGATGAGKSSLVKLLGRFYEAQSGQILWDGQSLADFSRHSLRQRIAYVPQETFLFSDTLARNITLGRDQPELALEAAKAVQADRVARDLPGGFEAVIGEQGRDLSAGERQLIAFARAVAQDPDVLILDEATANIDGETEAIIQASLERLLEGRTALVIAHRLSTIRNADKIVVLHKGELREQGRHDELIAKRGLYETLYRLQGEAA